MTRIRLPRRDGTLHDYTLRGPSPWKLPAPGTRLIAGDEFGYSDALLGIFDPIAPAAAGALAALAAGDRWAQAVTAEYIRRDERERAWITELHGFAAQP